jgi:predicted AlkP superfamily phosphohydrolase/phosphomutase
MRTVLIGLDGATFNLLDPLMEQGVMPSLQEFMARGTRAELRSTHVPLTPVAWTSLATGRAPGHHGIFDFVRPEETDAGVYIKLLSAGDIRCETLWSMASRQDRSVTLLNFPVTYPAPRVTGFVIPASVTVRHLKRAVRPPELYTRLQRIPGVDVATLAMDMEIEKKGIQGLDERAYEPWIQMHLRRDEQWFRVLQHLLRTDPTDLTAIVFDSPDRVGHLAWRLLDPTLLPEGRSAWEERVHQLCLNCFRQLDRFIAEIVADVGSDADVFIVSDHGFGPSWDIFYVNRWLEENGYLHWGPEGAPTDDADSLLAQKLKTQYGLIDWRRTAAYTLTPGGNGIHIRVANGSGRPGISPKRYESFREELTAGLRTVTDPRNDERIVTQVLRREEIFAGSQMCRAPDLTLVLRDFGFVSVLNSDSTVKRRTQVKGLHRPDGIFIAAGSGIRSGARVDRLSIMDVCPALLHCLDLPIPADLDGRLPAEVFAFPQRRSFTPAAVFAPVSRRGARADGVDNGLTGVEEEAVLSRLRSLGYIE